MFWSVGWPLLRAEGFFCNLDILYGGLGIGILQFLIKKEFNFFFSCNFFSIFGLYKKALDPDWIRIRIGVHPKMLDPDPDEMDTDQQPCRGAHLLLQQQVLGALPFSRRKKLNADAHTSAALFSCMSSSRPRHWRGCVSQASSIQTLGAHLLLQQQVLGAPPLPKKEHPAPTLSLSFLFIFY